MGENASIDGATIQTFSPVEPLPHELLSREDVCLGLLDVASQEVPGLPSEVVRQVEADVASPHDRRPRVADRLDEARRLRVVQEHDVVRSDRVGQLLRGLAKRLVVHLVLGLAQ